MPKAVGYSSIKLSWNSNDWGGLVRSRLNERTLLEGSAGATGRWYYAVGCCCSLFGQNFPGPINPVNQVNLWVRISDDEYDRLLLGPYSLVQKSKKCSNLGSFIAIVLLSFGC